MSAIDSPCPQRLDELTGLVALQQIEQLGPIGIAALLAKAGTVTQLLQQPPNLNTVVGLRTKAKQQLSGFLSHPRQSRLWIDAENALAWLAAQGHSVILKTDENFPKGFLELGDCPPLIYCAGDSSFLNKSAISIVGTRKPSGGYGLLTERLASQLAAAGLTIVSGMAVGIDAAAHRGALAVGGQTVAVWATGLDIVYPPSHSALAQQIIQHGCVITEMPVGTPALPSYFPRRNRLVSALGFGVLVVQAGLPSGSLITAHYAAEQNREVFAMPGSVQNPLSRGCHQLIKDGAVLVESETDILAVINQRLTAYGLPLVGSCVPSGEGVDRPIKEALAISPTLQTVLAAIGYDPSPFEVIESLLSQPVEGLTAALVDLELEGLIQVVAGLYTRNYQ
jgi:DNA processing protein